MRQRHAEPVGDLGRGGQVHGLLAAGGGLGCPHVAVVDVGLQVTLGQVGALASRHHAAHVEGAALALLDTLHRVCAVVQGQTEHTRHTTSVTHKHHKSDCTLTCCYLYSLRSN